MLQKTYIKSRKKCKVKFQVPENQVPTWINIKSLALVGDFNEWDPKANPMKATKKGVFQTIIEIEPGEEIQFRFLANDRHWFNAWEADSYVPNEFGSENCVVRGSKGVE